MKPLKNLSTPSLISMSLFLFATTISSLHAAADELAVPVGRQGAEKLAIDRPKTAMTTNAVETRFGAPLHKTAAVGTPPISSWEYPEYTVYFESDRVIHSVLKPFSDASARAAQAPVDSTVPATATEVTPTPAAADAAPAVDAPSAATSDTSAAPVVPAEATEAAK